jgi:hypothetical protein
MPLRSEVILKVHSKLAAAASQGYGLLLEDLRKLCPPNRNPFGVIWELRRHGAELAAVRKGRTVVGWVLKTTLPVEKMQRLDDPTPQTYVEFDRTLFATPVRSKTIKARSKKKKTGRIFSPLARGPLTKAGKRIEGGSSTAA